MRLGDLSPDRLCGLVAPAAMERLAFAVEPGEPREISFDPPVRGCLFEAVGTPRSVLISAQPEGFGTVGWTEVDMGRVPASKTRHANDCTVYAGVAGATLQVTVTATRVEAQRCENAEDVTGYVLEALVH